MNLGFTIKQAQSILRFKDLIGGFKSATDVQKLYVMSPERFRQLKPYLIFPRLPANISSSIQKGEVRIGTLNGNRAGFNSHKPRVKIMVDINQADSLE
ncbi:MAG: hypothetical protein EOO99_02030 [Pedobacter sp.]|nr:MAG: hypothetical protein EOO99_02030 [Pedobacter sp.]